MPKYIMGPSMRPNRRNIGPRYTQEQRELLAYYRQQIRLADRELIEKTAAYGCTFDEAALRRWRALMQQHISDIQRAARTVRSTAQEA